MQALYLFSLHETHTVTGINEGAVGKLAVMVDKVRGARSFRSKSNFTESRPTMSPLVEVSLLDCFT